jgi:hypothetical protein
MPPPLVRLFNLDLHASVIQDVIGVLRAVYGDRIAVDSCSISGHAWLFGRATARPEHINAQTWRRISPAAVDAFNAQYKTLLEQYDGFIVTHTPVFCMIFERYGKPIILVNSCRYDQPFCWTADAAGRDWLNAGLRRMDARGQLIAVSNNRADQEYLRRGAGVESAHVPSLCAYAAGGTPDCGPAAGAPSCGPAAGAPSCGPAAGGTPDCGPAAGTPSCGQAIVYGDRHFFPDCADLGERPPPGYSWASLHSSRAIVHTPYEVSTMSIFEQYSAGCLLFMPTRELYRRCIDSGTMRLQSDYSAHGDAVAARAAAALPAAAPLAQPVEGSTDPDFWLDRADFYDGENMPSIRYYSSAADLVAQVAELASSPEPEAVRGERLELVRVRAERVLAQWRRLIDGAFGDRLSDVIDKK